MSEIITQQYPKSQVPAKTREPYTKKNLEFWANTAKGTEHQKKVVALYDSSLVYSYNKVASVFKISPQRVAEIHSTFPHDCPRKKLQEAQHDH